jgi:FKBP-type peptidyl-prolyl cis-trans isomerase
LGGKAGCNFDQNSDNTRLKINIMKKTALILAFCLGGISTGLLSAAPNSTKPAQVKKAVALVTNTPIVVTNLLSDEKSRDSYAFGMLNGHNWQQQGIEVDWDMFSRGFKDAQSGGAMLMTPQEMRDTLAQFQKVVTARQQQMREEQAVKIKVDGEAFLAANKIKPGVVTLPDGLQYKVITDGTGPTPADGDTVTANYRGTFIDGTEFDTSAKLGKPAQFQVGRVIPGWNEALKLMKTGSKWQLFVPSELAYGQTGMQQRIPPNSVLVFDVELVSVEPSNPAPATAPPPSANPPLTSDIIKVPSAEELKKGAKIEIIKPEDVQKLQQSQSQPAN